MAETTEVNPKKTRSKRLNYAIELDAVRQYCEVNIEVLGVMVKTEFLDGRLAAFQAVLNKINGGK